jgi:membrane-bound metal-dependent hydrolase YbcI (DUF457 family)
MLGKSHFVSGTALYLGVSLISEFNHFNPNATLLTIHALLAGVGGLLPDFDHHTSKITKSIGFVTKNAHKGIVTISTGHRKGTHSLLALFLLTFLFFLPNFIKNF